MFVGTFGAGKVFNLYSQPQDPQMQVNVMPWLTVAWGLLAAALLDRVLARHACLGVLAVLSVAPLAWNVVELSKHRGRDAQWIEAVASVERHVPPASTVFLYFGFETTSFWQYALWSHTWDWDKDGPAAPAPSTEPKFKWIAVNAGAIRHPKWTAEEHTAALKGQIEMAFDRGYRIVVSYFWDWSVDYLADQLVNLSAEDRAGVLHAMLHGSYEVAPLFTDRTAGIFYELKRRAR